MTKRLRASVKSVAEDFALSGVGAGILGELAVEEILVEMDGEGKIEAIVAEFAIYLDTAAYQEASAAATRLRQQQSADNVVSATPKHFVVSRLLEGIKAKPSRSKRAVKFRV